MHRGRPRTFEITLTETERAQLIARRGHAGKARLHNSRRFAAAVRDSPNAAALIVRYVDRAVWALCQTDRAMLGGVGLHLSAGKAVGEGLEAVGRCGGRAAERNEHNFVPTLRAGRAIP